MYKIKLKLIKLIFTLKITVIIHGKNVVSPVTKSL